jgi:methyl-accepting chemotaxis protein
MSSTGTSVRTTIADIIAQREAARKKIGDAQAALKAEIQSIRDDAFGRPVTAEEQADIDKHFQAIDKLTEADTQVARATVQLLNQSAEAQKLAAAIDGVNNDMKKTLDDVKGIAARVGNVNHVIQQIDGVLAEVLKLAKMFPLV